MRLYIAEKPSVANDIANALGGDYSRCDGYIQGSNYIVTWCFGHILETCPPEEYNKNYGKWCMDDLPLRLWPIKLQPKKDAEHQLNVILKLISRDDVTDICNAGDPDPEGQILVDEVIKFSKSKKPVKRLLINDNTPAAVKKALLQIKDNKLFHGLYLSALARTAGDHIYGMTMTRAYTLLAKEQGYDGMLSAGRVQTPILGLIAKRWLAHNNHTASFFYKLKGKFSSSIGSFTANWKVPDYAPIDEKKRLIDRSWGENLAKSLTNSEFSVSAAGIQNKKISAPLPFSLVRLQQRMNKLRKLSAKKTLDITQQLREKHKAITYNRSDCSYLSTDAHNDAPVVLNALKSIIPTGINIDPSIKSKAFNDVKLSTSAHGAIIPTDNVPKLELLTEDEKAVYIEICNFYVAQFMPEKSYFEASAILESKTKETFSVRSRQIIDYGFESLINDVVDSDSDDENDAEYAIISQLRIGGKVNCGEVSVIDCKTTPPPLFNEATLLAALVRIADFCEDQHIKKLLKEKDIDNDEEHGGIGTAATRADKIETLKKRGFVEVTRSGAFVLTELGLMVYNSLPKSATNPDLTALWSVKQKQIEKGELTVDLFVEELYDELELLVKNATLGVLPKIEKKKEGQLDKLNEKCPSCKSDIAITGKRYSCVNCKFGVWNLVCGKKITVAQAEKLLSKGVTSIIKGFISPKTGKSFDAKLVLKDKVTGNIGFQFDK